MPKAGKYEYWLKPENLVRIEGWRRDGLTLDQIAHNMHVCFHTLKTWQERYEPITKALKTGAEASTYEVENAMYKSAIGYDVTEVEKTETVYPDGTSTIQTRQRRRHIPPSIAAQIFILKNRRPDWWKDTRTIENKSDGQLAALIDGLKEPANDLYPETT